MARDGFVKVCMRCRSPDVRVFSGDDNDAFGLNPKYSCNACAYVGMVIEVKAGK
ncbi:MAG: hypothetical protein HY544_03950 [Candidatus Diapherotrites archaeon]|uniref:Uncharacterized protein n=1 Tax=Candidatus Iainarchaeum sp. TaxID=3101447 RepID=A0A8T3YPF7_9ARCH|nr:hypothetical protein [Candidatus Diapherotrites archaeon]